MPLKSSAAKLPPDYLEYGQGNVMSVRTGKDVHAEWTFSQNGLWPSLEARARPCTLRTTMLGAPDSEVYSMMTRPFRPENYYLRGPADWSAPIHTLIVRRTTDDPFVAVHDTTDTEPPMPRPDVQSLDAGLDAVAIFVHAARSHYLICHATTEKTRTVDVPRLGKVRVTGEWCVVEWPADQTRVSSVAFQGRQIELTGLSLSIVGDPATLSARYAGGRLTLELTNRIACYTLEGKEVLPKDTEKAVRITEGAGRQAVRREVVLKSVPRPTP